MATRKLSASEDRRYDIALDIMFVTGSEHIPSKHLKQSAEFSVAESAKFFPANDA